MLLAIGFIVGLDIASFLRIIRANRRPHIKAMKEESKLAQADRDVQANAETCARWELVEVPS